MFLNIKNNIKQKKKLHFKIIFRSRDKSTSFDDATDK